MGPAEGDGPDSREPSMGQPEPTVKHTPRRASGQRQLCSKAGLRGHREKGRSRALGKWLQRGQESENREPEAQQKLGDN